ncbi:MAG: hypothetical protein GXP19_08145 [Gammaproteobacteria bacterium]|nr:hypothetical protein [Gammaproteobacteria bacterium]
MNQPQTTFSDMQVLAQINYLPLKLEDALFQHYPAMKLGQQDAVAFYSEPLAAIATTIYQQSEHHDWVITAPPCHHLPAAANLLARKVHQLLALQDITTALVEPRLNQQQASFNNEAEFKRYYDYSKNSVAQRIAERQRVQDALEADELAQHFEDKSLIIINDINVTGTQQRFMQLAFEQCNVKACHWLYIFNVETSLANLHPELEHQINYSQIKSLNSFSQVLADSQTDHTARCISRLFNEELDNFHYLASRLTVEKRQQLHWLAVQEGRYSGKIFEQKMQLLDSAKLPLTPSLKKSTIEA